MSPPGWAISFSKQSVLASAVVLPLAVELESVFSKYPGISKIEYQERFFNSATYKQDLP